MFSEVYTLSDKGLKRETNEDSFVVNKDKTLLVVSDGMGGYQNGDIASKIIVDIYEEDINNIDTEDISTYLDASAKKASAKIKEYSLEKRVYKTIGATVVGVYKKDNLALFHMGDSRVYRIRDKKIEQLSNDHIYKGNVISKAIGNFDPFELEVNFTEYKENDIYLLCSDGICNFISDQEMNDIINNNDLSKCCKLIKEIVFSNGAKDNLTLILGKI